MNMFNRARVNLTIFYLLIIMVISSFFSFIIYKTTTIELNRIQTMQRIRRPVPNDFYIDPEIIDEAKGRIAFSLLTINAVIIVVSGVGGYFLAGKTLDPIEKMLNDQKDFVSNASHELRTPLTSLKTSLEVALRDKGLLLKEAKDVLRGSLDDVNGMTKLTNYLLKLGKYKDGIRIEKVDFDISQLASKVAQKFAVKTKIEKNIHILGDSESISELITILIDNAVKYSANANGILVGLHKLDKGKSVVLEVSDKGQGISREDLPRIFDRFYRADKSRSKDGYGLGLSIAKQIIEAHGAKIQVISALKKGSTFKVIFS